MKQEIGKFRKELEKDLDQQRFEHSLGVEYTSACLAFIYGCDVNSARIAGLLHDCAKCLPDGEKLRIMEKGGIKPLQEELDNHSLLHSKAGAILAHDKYGIADPDILNAIRYHTVGRPNMSLLEKIVFVADFIEPNRKPLEDMDIIRKEAFSDIDKCLAHILHNSVIYLQTIGKECDDATMNAYEYYKKFYKL